MRCCSAPAEKTRGWGGLNPAAGAGGHRGGGCWLPLATWPLCWSWVGCSCCEVAVLLAALYPGSGQPKVALGAAPGALLLAAAATASANP